MDISDYWRTKIALAWRGTVEFANDWQWVFGTPVVLGFVATYFAHNEGGVVIADHPILDGFVVALATFAVTAFIAFVWRLFFIVPYMMYAKVDGERNALRKQLDDLVDQYAFALELTQVTTNIGITSPGLGYQPVLDLHNSIAQPLKFRVVQLDVWFDGAALSTPINHNGSVIAANGSTKFFGVPSPNVACGNIKHQAVLEVAIEYGHPSKTPVRRWRRSITVSISTAPPSAPYVFNLETDEPIP